MGKGFLATKEIRIENHQSQPTTCTSSCARAHEILSGMSVSGKRLYVEYSIWRTEILRDEGLKFCEKLSANGTGRRRLTMQQFMLQYVQVALGQEWPSFFVLFGGTKFMHTQYIGLMYELDSTRQKFDVWKDVAFLSDNATRPVECAAEMRQPIQTSNSVDFNSLNWILHGREIRRMNRASVSKSSKLTWP